MKAESEEYTVTNVEQELIQRFFRHGDDFMPVTQITDILSERTNLKVDARNISQELSKLGFKKARKRVNGSNLHGFYVEVVPDMFGDLPLRVGKFLDSLN